MRPWSLPGTNRLRFALHGGQRKLGWDDGTRLTAIGTDAGLLEKPETRPYLMLAPGERIDLWLDFSGRKVGEKLVLYSLPYSGAMPPMYERMKNNRGSGRMQGGGMGMMGGMGGMRGGMGGGMGMMGGSLAQGAKFPIATFEVVEQVGDSPKLPAKLASIKHLTERDVDNADNPIPIGISMKPGAPQLNGKSFALNWVLDFEKVPVGSIKKIRIFHDHGPMKEEHGGDDEKGGMQMENGKQMQGGMGGMSGGMGMMGGGMMMSMAHPIHLHGQQYQILSRRMEGMRREEDDTVREGFIDSGWKDTVRSCPVRK